MTLSVDTSALDAVLASNDDHHVRAGAVWTELVEGGRDLLTTNYVLLEAAVFLQDRLGLDALHTFHEDIAPLLRVVWIGEDQHKAATATILTAGHKKLSIVDCVSFQTMAGTRCARSVLHRSPLSGAGVETVP